MAYQLDLLGIDNSAKYLLPNRYLDDNHLMIIDKKISVNKIYHKI